MHFLACGVLGGLYALGSENSDPGSIKTGEEILSVLHVLEMPIARFWGPGWVSYFVNSLLWGMGIFAVLYGIYRAVRWTYRRLVRRDHRPA